MTQATTPLPDAIAMTADRSVRVAPSTGPQSDRPRLRMSMKWVLIGGFVSLLVLLSGTLIVSSFLTTERVTERLARDIMQNIAGYTISESQAFLSTARDAADLTQRLADSAVVDSQNRQAMERYFFEQLILYPQFAGIYFANTKGEFVFVSRNNDKGPNGFRTKTISIAPDPIGRRVELTWRSHGLRLIEQVTDPTDAYDPRLRPWYVAAVQREGLVWTDPYVFYSSRKPGVTTASPVFHADGSLRGVVGVDIEIDQISQFIAQREIGRNGSAFILHRTGQVIAFPQPEKISYAGKPDEPARLPHITEIDDPLSRQAFQSLKLPLTDIEAGRFVFTSFVHDGERYHAMFTPFTNPQWPWIMGIYMPESDYLGVVVQNQVWNAAFSVIVALLAIGLALWIAHSLARPIAALQAHALALRDGDFNRPLHLHSAYREMQDTVQTFSLMQDAVRHSQERYQLAVLGAHVALFDIDRETGETYLAPRAAEIAGIAPDGIAAGWPAWLALVHPEDRDRVERSFATFMSSDGWQLNLEYRLLRPDGETRWVLCRGTALRDELGRVVRAAGSISDVTDRKRAEQDLVRALTQDPLTGLLNSRPFLEAIDHALASWPGGREDGPILLCIDLDRFRLINDCLGRTVADDLLRICASRLTAVIGDDTILGRVAGDQFGAFLPGVLDIATAEAQALRVQAALDQPLELSGQPVYLTTSIGIARAGPGQRRADAVLEDARLALKRAKQQGRGRIAVFRRGLRPTVPADRVALEAELREAITNNHGLELHFQPVVDLQSGRAAGAEALVRWRHPQRGLLAPDQFIGMAEETELIVPLGSWVVGEACRTLAAWRAAGLMDETFWISVNVSRRQIIDPTVRDVVEEALAQTAIPPPLLKLEVTESLVMSDAGRTLQILNQLKESRVRLAIDDFGTGYSSLSLLHTMPFDTIKLDRAFVANLRRDPRVRLLVGLLMRLAEGLEAEVIAEGAETEAEVATLREMGCRLCQGYFFSRPLPADALAGWLSEPGRGEPGRGEPGRDWDARRSGQF